MRTFAYIAITVTTITSCYLSKQNKTEIQTIKQDRCIRYIFLVPQSSVLIIVAKAEFGLFLEVRGKLGYLVSHSRKCSKPFADRY